MTFQDWQLNSMTFQAWKMKFLNSMTFQIFHDLYEPCFEQLGPCGLCKWYATSISQRPREKEEGSGHKRT